MLRILSSGVRIVGLRVHLLGGGKGEAIHTDFPDTALHGVEVQGSLTGFPQEDPQWALPNFLELGDFAPGNEKNQYRFTLYSPAPARVAQTLAGVRILPERLGTGENTLLLQVSGFASGVSLHGPVVVTTDSGVIRRIYLHGRAVQGASIHKLPDPPPSPPEKAAPQQHRTPPVSAGQIVCRGQRETLPAKRLFLTLSGTADVEIDACVFLLNAEHSTVGRDENMIYFNHPQSRTGDVVVNGADVSIDLEHTDSAWPYLSVCYAILDGRKRFGDLTALRLLLSDNDSKQVLFTFPLTDLGNATALVGVELYRHKGQWKVNFVGGAYASGLARLCQSYGLDVES